MTAPMGRYARAPIVLPDESAAAFVRHAARTHDDRPALIFADRVLSYRDLAAEVDAATWVMAAAGLARGQRLGISLANTPAYVAWMLAALDLGVVAVPIADSAPAIELRAKATIAAIEALVVDMALADRRRAELASMPRPPRLLVAGGEMATLVARPPAPPVGADDLAVMPFSSGTTGEPKPILLSQRNVLAARLMFAQATGLDAGSALVHFLPLAHVYGWMALTAALGVGATVVLHARYDFDRLAADVERHGVNAVFAVSQTVIDIERADAATIHRLRSLRWVNTGSAPLAPAIMRAAAAKGGFAITTGYGLTEAAPVAHSAVERPDLIDVETVGFAVAGTELRLIDPDDPARPLAAGAAGELTVAGPQVSLGYLRPDGRLDRGAWLANGAFRTGDLVETDALGRLRIVGRIKNIIKYKGYSIAPAELEALLGGHPDVRDCAVIGEADAEAGEIPTAFVVARHEPAPSADELIAYVRERVAPQRRVRKVIFVDRIPRSGAGKVLTGELLAQV